jgi:hypothetical protein
MIHPCLIPNGQVIIFNFPAGAGGKMLQNCVGLSRHCVLNKAEYINWQINFPEPISHVFYDQKLQWILQTVPAPADVKNWLAFEMDKDDPCGIGLFDFRKASPVSNPDIYALPKQNLWITLTVHNFAATKYYKSYWPTMKHVCLVNNERFSRSNLPKKNAKLNYDSDWATLGRTPDGSGFEFDVDTTIHDTNKFLDQVEKLYEYLEFDDFQRDLISVYHSKYIELHVESL